MISESIGVNSKGHLTCSGADCVELAKHYGTPLYVFDEVLITKACKEFIKSIDDYYNGYGKVLYASKAFSCKEMYRLVGSLRLGADVVSGGELYTALSAGFDAKSIMFHGNNKTYSELQYAVNSGVGRIVVDNITELENLQEIAETSEKLVDVLLRIKPGIDAHTHDYIRTGQIDSKFGFALENGEAMEAALKCLEYKNISLKGFHCHIGSQIFDTEPFEDAAKVMIDFMADFRDKTGVALCELDLGGGFGVKYVETDDQIPFSSFMEKASVALKERASKRNFPIPFIYIEPGRSIVGTAGITLYTVGSVKTIKDVRTYVSIDGGMSDNPRYALYQAEYTAVLPECIESEPTEKVTVAGRCCESGDLIGKDMMIPLVERGQLLAVLATGAYNFSMASNYNRIPRPAVVMLADGEDYLAVRRETFADIAERDV